ncbi:helix-turn-helix domain-containing protein [Novosphingobium profundi]|uniref:helix-turn-helix domain-containing protein n=1 Tax=Novosphingobium profundi TaxID=1774954 RepID=UPI001BDAF498|nr:helix-turn-helix domain-containing protein [Novosphingobium profundi]MBT0667742.1 helix-turn-helix domain-containing protein [Novosphingobium profundi]
MQFRKAPAFDPLIIPEQGVTPHGQPLSFNRAPAADLAPWVGRIYVSKITAPAGHVICCGQFNDLASLRVQLSGNWEAETLDGPRSALRNACLTGPQSRRMPVRVTGSFISLGVAVRPGAYTALKGPSVAALVDRIVPTEVYGLSQEDLLNRFDPDDDVRGWALSLEDLFRDWIALNGSLSPDPVTAQFEQIAYATPSITVAEAARACRVDRRRLERIVLRDFGLAPKQVLRRARALDMASQLRGVADSAEANDIILRYYDESHLIHEFTELFGMSPGQFVASPQPLLTLSLESRQARRLEDLARIAPGGQRPWLTAPN